jgi:hypothetical protein
MSTVTATTRTLPASSQRIAPQKFAHVVLKTANYGGQGNETSGSAATEARARRGQRSLATLAVPIQPFLILSVHLDRRLGRWEQLVEPFMKVPGHLHDEPGDR